MQTTVSNCFVWAYRYFWQQMRLWEAAGRPVGCEPYVVWRAGRNRPRWLGHWLVGARDENGRVCLCSFKPRHPTNAPWYLAWRHLWFEGCAVYADDPRPYSDTEPTAPGDLPGAAPGR